MKAITTRYLGPTDFRGSRIKASDEDANSFTIPYPHEARMGAEAHSLAAIALCRKMGWDGELVSGATRDGYAFCFATSERFPIHHDPIVIRS